MLKYHGCSHAEVLNTVLTLNGILDPDKVQVRGVEVGVRSAETSYYLLLHNPNLTLHLVDPYTPYNDCGTPFTQEMQDEVKKKARDRLRDIPTGDWIWHEQPSLEAADQMIRNSVDFVFIDAEHTYDACWADMKAWYPVIRSGGVLSGHDFSMTPVKKAVTNFAQVMKLDLLTTEPSADVWAMQVP